MATDESTPRPAEPDATWSPLPLPPVEPGRARRAPTWAPTAVFAAIVLVIGAVVVLAGDPGDPSEPVLEAEDAAEGIDPGIGFAGPRDGLDSLRLPVQVTPADGLADGQTVTVTGQGFPANTPLGVVMCTSYGPSPEGGVTNCQISPYTSVTSDAQGTFSVEHAVSRHVRLSNGVHDCAAPPPDGAERNCVVAVGAISDYDQSGITPVTFDPDLPATPPLWVGMEPAGPVDDGDPLTITISNAEPGSTWWVDVCGYAESDELDQWGHTSVVGLCASGEPAPGYCDDAGFCTDQGATGTEVVVDASGSATFVLPALATIVAGDQVLDCREPTSWCEVVVRDALGGNWHSFPVQFAGAVPPSAPTAPPSTTGTTLSGSTETTVAGTTATSIEVTSPPVPGTAPDTTIPPTTP